ncbi:MAG: hypothetical protein LBI28_01495 [Treponema sp.]|jgi:hypothetical protein|nr:hypothetical protein [Treponema sp.]
MDTNEKEDSLEEFLYPFSWRNPLIYIVLVISICLYFIIYFIHQENETFGIINASKGTQIAVGVIVVWFFYGIPYSSRNSHFMQKFQESIVSRVILLIIAILLAMVCMTSVWKFYEYDNQKMDIYSRILPFKNAPYFKTGETLVFSNIKSFEYYSKVDTQGGYRFYLHNGPPYNFTPASFTRKSVDIFMNHLYNECDWLQDDIEKNYNNIKSIENLRKRIEKDEYIKFNIDYFILGVLGISMILIGVIRLIVFTLKIRFKFRSVKK